MDYQFFFFIQIWSCYFSPAKLSPSTVIGGLWFGEEKPNMHVFLKPIAAEHFRLETVEIEVKPPLSSELFVTKVILLAGTCDLPAC